MERLPLKRQPFLFSYNKFERAFKSDHAVVLLYDSAGKFDQFTDAALRSDSSVLIEIPKDAIYPLHVWMFFHNPGFNVGESKDKISDSVYLGIIRNQCMQFKKLLLIVQSGLLGLCYGMAG